MIKNARSKAVILWFLTCMAVGVWGVGLSLLLFAKNNYQAIICDYILYAGASLIPIFFYHFVSVLILQEKKDRLFIISGYIIALIFFIFNFIPPLLASGASGKCGFNFWVDAGIFYIPFVIYFWIYIIMSIYQLIKSYKRSDGISKRKVFYIIIGAVIAIGGGGTNFFPQLFGIYPFGNFVTFLYPILITYGMFLKKY